MGGWTILALLGLAAAALLWRAGLDRRLWSLTITALMLGAVGYAWQGSPGLAASPARAAATPIALSDDLLALRDDMLGRFTGDGAYVIASDGLMRAGNSRAGVNAILLGLRHYPHSLTLWTGLGTALSLRDDGISPAARFAFEQAGRLGPMHPAPPFFAGLAHIRSGDFAAARPFWARALALAPGGVSYRKDLAIRLALLDQYLAETSGSAP